MPDLQRYPRNLNRIRSVDEIVVFLTRKVFIFVSFSIAYSKHEMRKSR